jgi:excisionase family DNA binding protein
MTKLLSVDEAAERLSVSRWTIYRLRRDGKLKLTKIRGSTRVSEREIERYLRVSERNTAA